MKTKYVFLCGALFGIFCLTPSAGAITKTQEAAIADHCSAVKESLKAVQRSDARARVYVGGRYETILNKFVMPLNVWLVEKNMSRADLIESQNTIAQLKLKFANDYVEYQQGLEQLVAMDCKTQVSAFYDKLVQVRTKRKAVEQDMQKVAKALDEYKVRVGKLKEIVNEKAK
ncbi:hypothetical protein IKG60_01130 [Candidatus Saccharibacteria bacterium]|nr:hypothetical protein [Candidatus Saccharibacteria bacterium]